MKPPLVGARLWRVFRARRRVDGAVAGLLRWATLDDAGNSVAGSVFACPIDRVFAALAERGIGKAEPRCPYPGLFRFALTGGGCFSAAQ
ncbi:MAG: hypothetical protein U0787_08735 [Polyangia bacterium]